MPLNRAKIHFDNEYNEMNKHAGPFILFQVGDLCCEPGYCVKTHRQVVYEISYIVSGEGYFFTDNEKYKVAKGALYVNRIGENHEIQSSLDNPLRFFYLGFDFSVFEEQNEIISKLKNFFDQPENRIVSNVHSIQEIFVNMFTELITQDFLAETMLESYIWQIISHTYRIFSQKKYHSYSINESEDRDSKLVYDIIHYIDTEVESIDSLSNLSKEFGYSYSRLAQKFTSIMGENLKTYYMKRRFEKSKEEMHRGTTITDISQKLGYKSIHAFSRAFHKHEGMAPSEYKKWAGENRQGS